MTTPTMVRARTYCARCERFGRWFPCREDRASDLIADAWQKHLAICPRRAAS